MSDVFEVYTHDIKYFKILQILLQYTLSAGIYADNVLVNWHILVYYKYFLLAVNNIFMIAGKSQKLIGTVESLT